MPHPANPSGKETVVRLKESENVSKEQWTLSLKQTTMWHLSNLTKTIETRYEQGVMVSMVDKDGKLIPEQGGARSTSPAPVVIRKGLDIDKIMMHLSDTFNSWDYRQGEYY